MILLDTQTLLWWTHNDAQLSRRAQKIIEEEVKINKLYVSAISFWEIALLVKKNRLKFVSDLDIWIETVLSIPVITSVPADHRILVTAVNLPAFTHADPADRIIISTALSLEARIITSDRKIRGYKYVKTVW